MPRFFRNIPVRPDYKRIMRRMGYKTSTCTADKDFTGEIVSWIDEACSFITLSASAERVRISASGNSGMNQTGETAFTGEDGKTFVFKSISLSKYLSGAGEMLLLGITAGTVIMESIRMLQENSMTKAVVFDAAASEITDSGLDYILKIFSRELARESKKLFSKRFSPGYGDLDLFYQKYICSSLQLEKIGVKLTDSFMLIPEKSVTAIAGIA